MADYSRGELLATVLADTVGYARCITVGAVSPIPAAAALLVRETAAKPVDVIILGSTRHFPFTDGGREVFDFAGRGRIDVFFLGGGQIDGAANINLVGAGPWDAPKPRFPGSFGSAYLYYLVPRVILFREEHSRRVLVPKVDFVSAPGSSPPEVHRPGGPAALVTGKARFAFDKERRRFRLVSIHPGHDLDEIVAETGFDFDHDADVPATPAPTDAQLAILRSVAREELADTYPEFVRDQLAGPATAA
ncbi:MAG: CoA synthetase [Rhodospirillaceae bacterium]|nr:CoA synthetase [Rhodospirillaceae bacterium]